MPRFEPHPARRTTVVAGASSGIGAATATELAGRGFPVALGARRMDKLAELVDKIRADGGEAVAFPLDVTDPESVKSFVAQTVEALGEVELLVSSAGDMLPGQLHEVSTEAFAEQVQIHLVGANRLATAVLPAMAARRRGDLIFVGSDVGLRQRPHMGAYGAGRYGHQPADGVGRHRCSRIDRASGTHADRYGLAAVGRTSRPNAGGLGKVGAGPAQLLLATQRPGTRYRVRRRNAARVCRGEHGDSTGGPAEGCARAPSEASTGRRGDAGLMSAVALPRVSGGHDEHGHLEEFRTDPIGLMQRVRDECGDVGTFQLAGKQVVLLSGSHANEFFFRAGDDDLDQAKAYPFMTPIFGEGVVFDASPERRKEMLHNAALRGEQMKGHAATIEDQVRRMIADWGEAAEIDLLDFFAELTIYTSSACLIGKKFRDQLDGRFAKLYHELERGTDPLAYVDPYLPIESFRRRDEARNGLVALVADIMNGRIANPPTDKSDRDMLDVLIAVKAETGTPRFSADEITGMFISMMFAGHHTSSGTASWTLIELMRHRDAYAAVIDELDELYGDGRSVSFHALRQIPQLENVLKETLRLHPPLIILMRVAKGEFEVQGHRIHEGDLVAASPAISNRIPEDFPDPHDFVPARYEQPRQEDLLNRWTWIPFGAGRHRCVGAAFAIMQIKAIFSVLLREYEFEMAQPPESYRNDHSKMVVQLAQPACVRYRRRTGV